MSQSLVVSNEDLKIINDNFKLFQASPKNISTASIHRITQLRTDVWNYFNKKSNPIEGRQEAFDLINKIHTILGYKLLEGQFKPEQTTKPEKPEWDTSTSTDDRIQHCKDFISFLNSKDIPFSELEPSHQAVILSNIWGTP